MSFLTLDHLSVGESAWISEIDDDTMLRDRLQELGFTENSAVTCLFSSIFGDPRAYRIKSTMIALRNTDACKIHCRTELGES